MIHFNHKDNKTEHIVNLYILYEKYHTHKSKFANGKPQSKVLENEINNYLQSIRNIINHKTSKTLEIFKQFQLFLPHIRWLSPLIRALPAPGNHGATPLWFPLKQTKLRWRFSPSTEQLCLRADSRQITGLALRKPTMSHGYSLFL